MTPEDAFLQDIVEHPDDDAPRLVYADWLEERGDRQSVARAEFIRVQVELAAGVADPDRRAALGGRQHELLKKWQTAWARPFRPFFVNREFRRGFIERATVHAEVFVQHAETILASAPLRHVKLRNPLTVVDELARCPALARLRSLRLNYGHLGPEGVRTFLSSPHLTGLTELDLGNNKLGIRGGFVLAERAPNLPSLSMLALDDNGLRDAGVTALASSPLLGQLTWLNLEAADLTPAGARALAESPHATGLVLLHLSRNERVGLEGARALLEGLPGLEALHLEWCVTPAGQEDLLREFPGRVAFTRAPNAWSQ
jgi:uncharacterized protein (TIGR02996 family)